MFLCFDVSIWLEFCVEDFVIDDGFAEGFLVVNLDLRGCGLVVGILSHWFGVCSGTSAFFLSKSYVSLWACWFRGWLWIGWSRGWFGRWARCIDVELMWLFLLGFGVFPWLENKDKHNNQQPHRKGDDAGKGEDVNY